MRDLLILLSITLLALPCAHAGDVTFRRDYVDGNHGQIHVLTASPAEGAATQTPMICLSPNPMAGRYYRLFMNELGKDRVVIAPDYPGLGQSDAPSRMMDLAGYADSMAEVLDALGYGDADKVDVCGYHTGAMVAVELAVRRPDLVRKLVIAGIPYYEADERKQMYEENVVAKELKDDFDSLRGSWEFTVTTRQEGVSIERGYDNFVDILLQRYITHWPYHAVFTYPAEEQAPKVTQPVLILNTHGSLEKETRAMAPLFPDATLIEIPELHHGVFDVGAERLAVLVRASEDGKQADR
ncbi:MAG: alpha/beta hydrolase [Gammaproteobacteria bacterium]|nr:alpha/beta hydrolase [Gammaproteobacteria bacterium]